MNTGLLTEEQAEAYRAELREEEAPPTAMAAAFEKQVAALKAEQDKLRQKNGRAPAPKSKNRAKFDELQKQIDALGVAQKSKGGDLLKRLKAVDATGVFTVKGENPIVDFRALKDGLIKARAEPQMIEAVLSYVGFDADGYLIKPMSREEAAQSVGMKASSGANVSEVAEKLGITAEVRSRFHASQTDKIGIAKNVSESSESQLTDVGPKRGLLYEPPTKKKPAKVAKFLSSALTPDGKLDFTNVPTESQKATKKSKAVTGLAEMYARSAFYNMDRNAGVLTQLRAEVDARVKRDPKTKDAINRAYGAFTAEQETEVSEAELQRTLRDIKKGDLSPVGELADLTPEEIVEKIRNGEAYVAGDVVREQGIEDPQERKEGKTRASRLEGEEKESLEEADESQYQLRQKPVVGMPKERVEQVVAKVTEGWVNLPPIEVVQSETDLPAGIQKQIKRDGVSGQVPGLYNNGKVWLIADNNASAVEIFDTIAHEVTGHYGLRGVLGNKFKETMKRIYDSDAEIRMLATDKMKKQPKMPTETAVEEVLADMQEKDRARPLYKRIVGIIRTALQKIFKGSHYFSRDQVEDLLWQSRAWVRKARKPSKVATTDEALFRVTPEAEKAAAKADVIGERKETTFREKVGRELKGNKALRLREKFTDSLAPLEDFFVNAYGGQVRTAGGRLNPMVLLSRALDALRVSKAAQEQGGLAKEDGLIVATELKNDKGESVSYKDVLKRIADTAKAEGKTYEEYLKTIDNVLYGHREYNLREKNKTAKPEDQIELLLNDSQIDALEDAFQKDDFIKGVLADLDTIRFNMLDMLVDTGRISQEQSQDYKDAIGYIPFERIGDYENAWSGATRGANRGAAALKRMRKLEGSDKRKSTSVVENFSGLMDWATKEAMKNEAASRALDDMLLMGAAKRGEAPATDSPGGEVMVYKDGKPSKFYVPDPAHLVAFSIADPQLSKILRGLQSATQVLRAGVTSMPPFAIKQVFDDIVRAYTYAGVKNNKALVKEVLFNFPKNWANEVLRRKPAGVRELEALGIVGTFDFTQQKNLKNILEEAGAKKEGLGTRIIRVMEAGAKASDLAVRQAIYNQVLKETGDKAQAESAAREIINFSRRGSSKMMNQMISVIPFFNAYARGMDKLATAAAGKVVGRTTGTARSMFYSRMAVLTSMGLMYALMMQDDDEYNSLPDHVRDANWVLPFGKELGFVPVIPVPAELAFFFKAIPERVVRYYKYQGTDEERTAMELLGEMTKRGIDVFSSPNVTPQAIRPLLENIVNYSFFLGRPLESQAQLKLRPFERYGVGTSDAMKAVAERLESVANATGIDAFAVSPIKLENAVRGLLGTAAGLSLSMADMVVNPDRTDRPLHQQLMPQLTGASAVMKNPVGTKYMDEIYNLENKTEQVYGTYNRLLKGTDPEKAEEFLKDNLGMYAIRPAVQAVMGAIRTLNQTAMTIDKDKSMSPEERRKAVDELRAEQNEIARQVFLLRKQAREIQATE